MREFGADSMAYQKEVYSHSRICSKFTQYILVGQSQERLLSVSPCLRGSVLILLMALSGCGGQQKDALPYHELVAEVLDPSRIARLDTPQAEIITSYDRSGGNDDHSNYMGEGPGDWKILADLKGPGYVSRFWTTGGHSLNQRLRFYFDKEKHPRIDATVDELRSGGFPFVLPLSTYEQSCWWSYVPMPYAKRLVIMAEMEKPPAEAKLFYQINYSSLGQQAVQSVPKTFSEADKLALRRAGDLWESLAIESDTAEKLEKTVNVPSGGIETVASLTGSAIVRELEITLKVPGDVDIVTREGIISKCRLLATWDGAAFPSIDMPVAQLCGRVWDCPAYDSLYFGFRDHVYTLRFPMPFRRSASFQLRNGGSAPVDAQVRLSFDTLPTSENDYGYFHAVSSQSSPRDIGKPHTIFRAAGRGKYAGCVLGALTLDNSWWLLEGDERIRIDDEQQPGWNGTGLEDYFNGAWYYQVPIVRALHGLISKVPFETVQYRLHGVDARVFQSHIDAEIERGPDNASRGWMQSVAYFYLAAPGAVPLPVSENTIPAKFDPLEQATIMSTLASFERFDDYGGASRYIDVFLSRYPEYLFAPILRLRQLAYIERTQGIDAARPLYAAFMDEETEPAALQMAKLLLWFHEDPTHAILSVFCSPPTRAYIDEKLVGTVRDARMFSVYPLRLAPGRHVLALETTHRRYPDWVQACLRTHTGLIGTRAGWLFEVNPIGNWKQSDYDASTWEPTGATIRTGPPAAPDVYTTPHPFVDMQAQALGLWAPKQWPREKKTGVFRTVFDFPMLADG